MTLEKWGPCTLGKSWKSKSILEVQDAEFRKLVETKFGFGFAELPDRGP
jgi:hypothetical protein